MGRGLCSLVVSWGFEVGVQGHHLGDEVVPLLLQLLARAELARVQALALAVVDGLRGGGPAPGGWGVTGEPPDPSGGGCAPPKNPLNPPSPRVWGVFPPLAVGGCGGVGRGRDPFGGVCTPKNPPPQTTTSLPPMATLCHCPLPPPGGDNWGGEH